MIKNITARELQQLINNNEAFVIDVREAEEFSEGFIDKSEHAPLGMIADYQLPKTNKKIIIYCRGGVRSLKACQILQSKYPSENFYNLSRGIISWNDLQR